MARILDTTPTFVEYARKHALASPIIRDQQWREWYHAAHPEVFEGFNATVENPLVPNVVLHQLSKIREGVERAAPIVTGLIEEVVPRVREVLGRPAEPEPLHVLLVDGFATNGVVGRMGDEVAVFHCLEWFQGEEGARLLTAHEGAHAWHELALGDPGPTTDLAWAAFYEGVGIQVSRAVVPDRPEKEYFWYELPGFDDWLPWCREHRQELLDTFAALLDDAEAYESYFGAGTVSDQRRVGYFIADELVAGLGRPLPELVTMSVEEARGAIRATLDGG